MRHTCQRSAIAASVGVFILLMASFTIVPSQAQPPAIHGQPSLVINGYEYSHPKGDFSLPDHLKSGRVLSSRYQVVQFTGPVQPVWKETLIRLGVRFFDYVPDFGFIVRIPPRRLREIRALPFVAYAGTFEPAFRLSRSLDERTDSWATVNVILFAGEDAEEVISHIERSGGAVLRRTEHDLQARIPTSALPGLANLESVRWVEEAQPIEFPNSTMSWKIQSGIQDYRPLWDHGLRGEGQIVGLADTGLDWDHECFYDPAHPQVQYSEAGQSNPPDLSHRKVVNYWRLHQDGLDPDGHGTHVAGTIACDNTDLSGNSGNPNGQGMAPKARLSFTDFTTPYYFPPPVVSDIPVVFSNSYGDNARIHNNSWAELNQLTQYTAITQAVDQYMWNHRDFLVVFANGNRGQVGPPATAKNVVSVGGGRLSFGPCSDRRIKPTVVSTPTAVSAASDGKIGTVTSGYWGMGGTSMASPSVAGGVALIRQYFTEGWYPSGRPNPGDALMPSAALMKATLLAGTAEVTEGVVDEKKEGRFPNNTQGWGFIRLSGSLSFAGEPKKLRVLDQTQGLNTGERITIEVDVVDTTVPFRAVLVWTDAPAAYGSTRALVNDLDLKVSSPDGKIYLGNVTQGLNPGRSITGGSSDRVNVEEGVFLPSPQYGLVAGTYTITVDGFNVPQGPQPFALVVVGGLEGEAPVDTVPPTVTATLPVNGTTDVSLESSLSITFSEAMDLNSVNSAFSIEPATEGTLTWDQFKVIFSPSTQWAGSTQYSVTISTLARDLNGNALVSPFSFSFTTADTPPAPPPAPAPPAAAFSANPTTGQTPLQVQFTDQSTGTISSWSWDFGDGATSSEGNPLHTYTEAGTYTVALTVTGPGGTDTETRSGFITVSPAVQPQRLVARIDSTTADALVYGNYFYSNANISYIGYYGNTRSDSTFWFGSIPIPQGADIIHAEIRLQAAMEVSWACAASIVGFAQDDPATVLSVADWRNRRRTNASAPWNMEPWLPGRWYSSPEIAPILQEIIDRSGWVPGRALAFSIGPAVIGTSYRAFYERDQGYGYGAELVIDYLP